MSKRHTHLAEFKAKVAMEAITGSKTLQVVVIDGTEPLIKVTDDVAVAQSRQWSVQGARRARRSCKSASS